MYKNFVKFNCHFFFRESNLLLLLLGGNEKRYEVCCPSRVKGLDKELSSFGCGQSISLLREGQSLGLIVERKNNGDERFPNVEKTKKIFGDHFVTLTAKCQLEYS